MERIDIINLLIQKNGYKRYLEIGVRNPDDCFNHIICELKHGVDPGIEGDFPVTFNVTSDEFFRTNSSKYDIIFIDGLHIDEQVERDIVNSLKCLNDGGSVVIHDCNPPEFYFAREDYYDMSTPAGGAWNGTVWKAILKVRSEVDGIYTSVVDTDWGVGIIQKSKTPNKIENDNPYFSFGKFKEKRSHYLNLISPNEFIAKYIGDLNHNGITWLAKFDDYSSMGILSQRILENLKQTDFSCKPIIGETETKNQKILDAISRPINNDIGIMFSYPDMVGELASFKTKVIYTGVDTTGGINNFAENSNKADYLLTPSNISRQRMIGLGVSKPIIVFPHGIDPEVFRYAQRKDLSVFRFLYVGECSDRKGIFQLLEAFLAEFRGNQNVELHIKSNNGMLFYGADKVKEIIKSNTNIFWHIGDDGHDQVIELYNNCHAYVYPSRADTFGMTLIEAMACGLPIISTSEPGATELIRGKYRNVPSRMVPVKDHPWMLGEWGEPDTEELKKQMLEVYTDYDRIIGSGELEEFSNYIRSNYSWEILAKRFESEILPELRGEAKKILEIADGPAASSFY